MLTEVRLYYVWPASTQLDYHGYFSSRVAAESSNKSEKVSYMKYLHSNIIIQKLDILAEFNTINDDQYLYILRGHKFFH